MDRNICSDGSFATEDNTCDIAWISETDYGCGVFGDYCAAEDKGPVTAMNYLSNATKTWTNTNEMLIDKFEYIDVYLNSIGMFDMQPYNTYARMPYYNEIDIYNGSNGYLYENLSSISWDYDYGQPTNNIENIYGYWTLSSIADDLPLAWYMHFQGNIASNNVNTVAYVGVRPVINVKL